MFSSDLGVIGETYDKAIIGKKMDVLSENQKLQQQQTKTTCHSFNLLNWGWK